MKMKIKELIAEGKKFVAQRESEAQKMADLETAKEEARNARLLQNALAIMPEDFEQTIVGIEHFPSQINLVASLNQIQYEVLFNFDIKNDNVPDEPCEVTFFFPTMNAFSQYNFAEDTIRISEYDDYYEYTSRIIGEYPLSEIMAEIYDLGEQVKKKRKEKKIEMDDNTKESSTPRQWLDAEEVAKSAVQFDDFWGWSEYDIVRKWYLSGSVFLTCGEAMDSRWDRKHQPTHVMPRKPGDERPESPQSDSEKAWDRVCRYVVANLDGVDVYKIAALFIEHEDRIAALEKCVNELEKAGITPG